MTETAGANTPLMPVRALGAPHTTWTGSAAGVDQADAQLIGFGVPLGLEHPGDGERGEPFGGGVLDSFHLQPERVRGLGDLAERGRRVEVIPEARRVSVSSCVVGASPPEEPGRASIAQKPERARTLCPWQRKRGVNPCRLPRGTLAAFRG